MKELDKKTLNFIYAGIGSRKTPIKILKEMTKIANFLNKKGYILRSGGAIGADKAFENGSGNKKEIFYAKDANKECLEIAKRGNFMDWDVRVDKCKRG